MSPGPNFPGSQRHPDWIAPPPPQDQPFVPPTSALNPEQDPGRLKQLNERAVLWLVIGVVGFSLAFPMPITGPLGWWQGANLCSEFEALGMRPSSTAQGAKIIGIITTIFAVLGTIVMVLLVLVLLPVVAEEGGF